ncbi:MAG: nucleoside phosphorylase [Arcobacteraceae bacterium]|nr:nucleoside phosphorylase [Arcobacteraceae bacterium]
MTLIHCAMLSEAQYIIEKLKLKLEQKNPKIYKNEKIVLIVSNIGKENTIKALELVYQKYKISKAINIGISGCSDKDISIGEVFCTSHKLEDIKYMKLQTVNTPTLTPSPYNLIPTLYDMEAKYFQEISDKYINQNNIFVFKVVSDHLDDTIPKKEFVKQLIKNSMKSWERWI